MDDLSATECRQHQTDESEGERRAARHVAPGECWAFVEHRSMAEEIVV
jgi:hypothetical protein